MSYLLAPSTDRAFKSSQAEPAESCSIHARMTVTLSEGALVSSIKDRPNHRIYIRALREMTPEQRLDKAFELADLARHLFLDGLRGRFPERSERAIHELYLRRIELCRKRTC